MDDLEATAHERLCRRSLDVAAERFRFAALHACYRSPPSCRMYLWRRRMYLWLYRLLSEEVTANKPEVGKTANATPGVVTVPFITACLTFGGPATGKCRPREDSHCACRTGEMRERA